MKSLSTMLVLLLSATFAVATPIQPDIKKLLSSPRPTQHFAPARVGWNGPEAPNVPADALAFSRLGAQADMRQKLIQLITPDWRVLFALTALIFLLRQLRKRSFPATAPAVYNIPVDAIEPDERRPAA